MMERRITVRGIIFNDGKLFAQKLKSDKGERDFWCTPGGGLDPNESLEDGLARELVEETGISPIIGKLLFVQQYSDSNKEFLEFFFHIENPEAYHTIDLTSTTHGTIEVARCEFIDPSQHIILPAFLQTIDLVTAISNTTPIVIKNYLSDTQ